jgi:formate dehydrogenase subunit gamma
LAHTHQVWGEARAQALIDARKDMPGATLPILHALQEEFGYVDQQAIPLIADALTLSKAEVVGVIKFYADFKETPPGHHTLKICGAESCQAMGCNSLVSHIEGRLGVKMGQTTPDGALSIETVYCLGNCALSPAVLMDGRLFGRVSTVRADKLIAAARDA